MTAFCLTVTCPSQRGIVAAIATYIASHGCNITDSAQFDDADNGRFFMRISAVTETGTALADLAEGFADDINAQSPDLIVASGDFTQIGTKEEFEQAREFLDKLTAPVFAVPGNHDVPAVNVLRRFLDRKSTRLNSSHPV